MGLVHGLQILLQHFPTLTLRQLLQEHNSIVKPVRLMQLSLHKFVNLVSQIILVQISGHGLRAHYVRFRSLAGELIRDADNGCIDDGWVRKKNGLNVAWEDLFALFLIFIKLALLIDLNFPFQEKTYLDFDHILDAFQNEQVSVSIR